MIRPRRWAALLLLAVAGPLNPAAPERIPQPRYVIFLMADGMGVDELELARQYSLAVLGHDLFLTGTLAREGSCALMDTYSSDSMITDSAAGASAWAVGRKIKNGQIAVDPLFEEPLQTISEYYKERYDFRTGIVTNDAVTGASPAAFAAHVGRRGSVQEIARQYCDQSQPEVILGGGRSDFLAGKRRDGRNLINDFVALHGYRYVESAEELARLRSGKVLGLFAEGTLTFQIDRAPEGNKEPMTTEMAQAALRILSADRPRGFFLFVEESVADKAGHKTDAAAMVLSVLEFDHAVAEAYRFYRRHPRETLLIATADHETGGLQWELGYGWEEKIRAADRREGERSPVSRLATVHASIGKAVAGLKEQLTDEERARLRWRYRQFQFDSRLERALDQGRGTMGRLGDKWDNILALLVAHNTGAYYEGSAHSPWAVPLFAIGVGAERFSGHLDNTDIGQTLFRLAGRQDFRAIPTSGPLMTSPPRVSPSRSFETRKSTRDGEEEGFTFDTQEKTPAGKAPASKTKRKASSSGPSSRFQDDED